MRGGIPILSSPDLLGTDPASTPPGLRRLVDAILRGRVLLLPTDTCYILAADATDPGAVRRVFQLKRRPLSKPIHLLVAETEDIARHGHVCEGARRLAQAFLPGLITLVLPRRPGIPDELVGGGATVGIRVPDDPLPRLLARLSGRPLTATSANGSGRPAPYDLPQALAGLAPPEPGPALRELGLEAAVDGGARPPGRVTTLVDPTMDPPRILRAGAIPAERIRAALQEGPER